MEEEVNIDDPILKKLNGTKVQETQSTPPPVDTDEDDPILRKLNSGVPLKKKEESALPSPDGSDSVEPVKPSETSTKRPPLSENQDRLKKLYEFEYNDWRDKRVKSLNDQFKSWAQTRLSEVQNKVNQDPSKADVLNDLFKQEQKTKAAEFGKTFSDEQDKKRTEMDKDLNKFLGIQKKRDNGDRKPDVLESAIQTISSGIADQIPKEYYTQRLRMSKGSFGDLFDPRSDLNAFSDDLPKEVNRDEFNQWNNSLNTEDRSKSYDEKAKMFLTEKLGKPGYEKLKSEFLVKNEKDRVGFEKAIQEQNKQAAFQMQGVVQDLRDVNGASDFLSFAGNMIGQALYRAPIAIASGTTGSIVAESAAVYDQQLDLIAEKKGLTREEVIKEGLDKPAEGQALSVALGVIDAVSAGTLVGVFKKAAQKELKRSAIKEFVKGFTKGAVTEGSTETIQTEGEALGAAKGADTEYSPDAWRMATSFVGGAIGGGVLSGGSSTNTNTKVEPAMQVEKVALDQKIQDVLTNVDVNNDNPANIQEVANAVENTVNNSAVEPINNLAQSTDDSLIIRNNEPSPSLEEDETEVDQKSGSLIPVSENQTSTSEDQSVMDIKDKLVKGGKLVLDEKGDVKEVKQNSGSQSQLFHDLKEIFGNSKRAINEYLKIKNDEGGFKKKYGDWENSIMKKFGRGGNEYSIKVRKSPPVGKDHNSFAWSREEDGKLIISFNNYKINREGDFDKVKKQYADQDSQDGEYKSLYDKTITKLRDLKMHIIHLKLIEKMNGKVTEQDKMDSLHEIERLNKIPLAKDYYGEPMIFMHSGNEGIGQFKKPGDKGYVAEDMMTGGAGIYFSRSPKGAKYYSRFGDQGPMKGKDLYYVFLKTKNPYYMNDPKAQADYPMESSETISKKDMRELQNKGYDSVIWDKDGNPKREAVVFNPDQVEIIGSYKTLNKQDNQEDQSSKKNSQSENTSEITQQEETKQQESSAKQRKFSKQLLNDLDLNSKVRKGLSEDTVTYIPKGIRISNDEARAIIEVKGADVAMTDFLDMTNGMLPDVRVMLGENLIRKFNAEENYDAAIKVADNLAMQLTDLGRGVNAAKSFSLLTPEGVLRYVQREITKSREKKSQDTAPKRKKSKDSVDDENKKAVAKILDPKSDTGKVIAEAVGKKRVKQAIDFLETLKVDQPKGMATAQIVPLGLPIAAWNLAINIIQKALQAGLTISKAVEKAIKKLKAEGYTIDEQKMQTYFNEQLNEYKEVIDAANLKKDRETRYAPEITRSEREDAVNKISEELVPKSGTKAIPKLKPAVQEFYNRLVDRMIGSHPKMKGKSADSVLKEVLQNIDKYADVLQGVRDELQERGVDVKDVQSIFDLPYFQKQISKNVGDDIRKVITKHYSIVSEKKLSLAEKLTKEAGLSEEDAIALQNDIYKAIDQATREEKKKALKKYLPKAKKGQEQERNTLVEELIEASNLGALDEDVYRNAISEKLGPKPMTAEDGAMIKRLADKIQTAKSEFDRNRAQEDLIRYIDKNVKGIRWTDVGMSIWYANVLSGLSTQFQNLYGNLTNTISEAYVTMALSPKESGWIFKGLFNGYGRGLLEAMDTVKSGYQPIKGDVKQVTASPVLENTTFKGGAWNPYNYLKYVTRLMAATDIFFYHGLKEMRSRELAVAAAKKENKVNPGPSAISQAKKQLYGDENAWSEAKEQAELEGYTGQEKTRRAYELLEKARPEFILEDSNDAALRGTYNNQPEGALGKLSGAINMIGEGMNIAGIKPLKFIVPFTRIIANVANTALDYSPWAFGRYAKGAIGYEGFGDNYYHKYTQEEKSKLLVKGITGTLAMAVLAALTDDDDGILEITADGTGDSQKNFELQETGWQPYSIKIGGTWYEYRNTPLAIPFAMIGYWRDGQKYKGKGDDDLMTRLSILTYGTLKYIMDLSFLQSLSGFFDSFSKEKTASGKNYFEKASKGTEKVVKSFIVPNAFTQASKSMQEIMDMPQKEANDLGDQIVRDMPVLRDRLDNMYNSLGDPVIPNQVSKFLPFKMKSEPTGKDKDLYQLITNNSAWIGKPGRTALKISSGESMTDEEYEQFCYVAGKATKAMLLENFAELRSMKNSEEIKDLVRKLKIQARREANIQLFGEKSYF